jgi:hypothetical protein
LLNPSFESGQTGWLDWANEELVDTTTASDGINSFHTFDSSSATRMIYQDVDVEAGKQYSLGYSFKTKNLGTNQAHIHINWLGGAGEVLTSTDVTELHNLSGTLATWDTRQTTVLAPLGAFKARIQLILSPVTNGTPANDAEVWFDNLSLAPAGGTPPTPQNLRVEDS